MPTAARSRSSRATCGWAASGATSWSRTTARRSASTASTWRSSPTSGSSRRRSTRASPRACPKRTEASSRRRRLPRATDARPSLCSSRRRAGPPATRSSTRGWRRACTTPSTSSSRPRRRSPDGAADRTIARRRAMVRPWLDAPVADELRPVRGARDGELEHDADTLRVDLLLDDVGLDAAEVARLERVLEPAVGNRGECVQADDARAVLGLAPVVLLAIGQADPRVRGEDDSRVGAVDACLPRAFLRLGLSVLVLGRVLAEVPEVALAVLGVPVEGVLLDLAVLAHLVVDDASLDPHDRLGPIRDGHDHARGGALGVGFPIDPAAAGTHGPVRVVDLGREVGRIHPERLASRRERGGRTPGARLRRLAAAG